MPPTDSVRPLVLALASKTSTLADRGDGHILNPFHGMVRTKNGPSSGGKLESRCGSVRRISVVLCSQSCGVVFPKTRVKLQTSEQAYVGTGFRRSFMRNRGDSIRSLLELSLERLASVPQSVPLLARLLRAEIL